MNVLLPSSSYDVRGLHVETCDKVTSEHKWALAHKHYSCNSLLCLTDFTLLVDILFDEYPLPFMHMATFNPQNQCYHQSCKCGR